MTFSFIILVSHSHSDSEVIGNHHNLGIVGGDILCVRMQKTFFKSVAIYQLKLFSSVFHRILFTALTNTHREHNDLGVDVTSKGSDY